MKKLLVFAEFVRKQYQGIIIGAVLLGLLLGLWTTAPGKALQTVSQALTFLMILFISLTITPRQFALVSRQPLAVISGLLLNFVFMPLLCWGLARLFVLAGTFTGILKRLQAFGRWNEALEKVAGIVVIAVGLYFVWIA